MHKTFLTPVVSKLWIVSALWVVSAPWVAQPASGASLSLRADSESQVIQNERADRDKLSRFDDRAMVQRFARLQLLHEVPARTSSYYIHAIPDDYQYLRPWTKLFLDRVSSQFRERFGKPLRITGLTRSATYQKSLRRRNGNAAAPVGPKRSVHLTGACLDISKKGMTGSEVSWMRRVLSSVKEKGYLHPVEEFKQPNFHVMVYRDYPEYVEKLEGKSD
jgi:hypothetical protein